MHITLFVKQRTTPVKHVSSMCLDTSGEEGGAGRGIDGEGEMHAIRTRCARTMNALDKRGIHTC